MRRPTNSKPVSGASSSSWFGISPAVGGLLFLFFLYAWLRIEPAIEYQHSGPVFLLRRAFLLPFLQYPGGLLDYAAALLSQFNYYSWLGALTYTLLAGLLFIAARAVLLQGPGRGASGVALAFPFLLLVVREQYDGSAVAVTLGLLLATASAGLYGALIPKPWRGLVGWVLLPAVFYSAGIWPGCLLAFLLATLEASRSGLKFVGLLLVIPIMAVVLWCLWFYEASSSPLHLPWIKDPVVWGTVCALYLLLPLAWLISLLQHPDATLPGLAPRPTDQKNPRPTGRAGLGIPRWVSQAAVLVVGWGVVWAGLALPRKRAAELDYYSSCREYERVLATAAVMARNEMNVASETRLHSALYHTGRLAEELFSYRSQRTWDLLPGLGGGLDSCRAQSRTFFELGLVSEAEHLAHEALENEGERPELLQLLAEVNTLKQRPQAARVFLHVLRQVPFHGGVARTCLRDLDANPQTISGCELDAVRPLMLTNDLAHQTFAAEGFLVQLLRRNPTNRMAFEYLMAQHLVNLEVNQVVDRLWQLDQFGFAGIPRHYAEALLLYEQSRGTHVELRGRKIRAETLERFRRFTEAMNQRQFTTESGRQALAREFGDTYWYYYFARRSETRQS